MSHLAGTWYNELGSKMDLIVDPNGGLSGTYYSAVGKAEYTYDLAGRYDAQPPPNEGTTLAWTVTFRNSTLNAHSTTGWSGQFFANPERILTHWLLTRSTTTEDVWNSTNLGTDTFTREEPSAADIEKAKAHRVGHPHHEHLVALRAKLV